jgi:hypothetical protein
MSIPQKRKTEFEQVKCDDFIEGEIIEVQEEMEHTFTGQYAKVAPAVRFVFKLVGYEFKHYSRWMSFVYGKKAALFSKYICSLVENPEEFMEFDVQNLKDMKVKILWKDEGEGWQSVETIRPLQGKIKRGIPAVSQFETETTETVETADEEIPF